MLARYEVQVDDQSRRAVVRPASAPGAPSAPSTPRLGNLSQIAACLCISRIMSQSSRLTIEPSLSLYTTQGCPSLIGRRCWLSTISRPSIGCTSGRRTRSNRPLPRNAGAESKVDSMVTPHGAFLRFITGEVSESEKADSDTLATENQRVARLKNG